MKRYTLIGTEQQCRLNGRPARKVIAIDVPREPTEAEMAALTKAYADNPKWPCVAVGVALKRTCGGVATWVYSEVAR